MIKVYSKPNCVQCQFTKQWLDNANIAYDVLNVEDPVHLEAVKALGYQAVPVVETPNDHWSGFNPDKLETLVR